MIQSGNYIKGYFLLTIVALSCVNAELFVKLLDRETIKRLQLNAETDARNNEPIISALGISNKEIFDEKTNGDSLKNSNDNSDHDGDDDDADDDEMEEEIIAEDEDGNMFLLVPKDLIYTKKSSLRKLINEDADDEEEANEDERNDDEQNDEITPITGSADGVVEENDEDYILTNDEDEDNVYTENQEKLNENDSDDIGRGHKHQKRRKIKYNSYIMNKPFRKFKRIIRRGIKHPKRTFKKVLKAIILPKSAVGIITSSMLSNAIGFGSGGLAGMTAGTIAGGIASGIFRNFGSVGKTVDLIDNKAISNRADILRIGSIPIAYMRAN